MDIETARKLKKDETVTFKDSVPFYGSYQLLEDARYDKEPIGHDEPVVWLHLLDVKGGSMGESDYHHDLFEEPAFA